MDYGLYLHCIHNDNIACPFKFKCGGLSNVIITRPESYSVTNMSINILDCDKILAIGRAYNKFFHDYSDYFNALLYYESRQIDVDDKNTMAHSCDNFGHRALDILIEAVREGIKDGSIRSELDPEKTAITLWGQTTGMIQLLSTKGKHLKNEHEIDINGIVEYSFELMVRSLKG